MQWELASYYPAGSSVEAATTQSRHHVKCNGGYPTGARKAFPGRQFFLIPLLKSYEQTTYREFVTTLNTVIKRYSDILAQCKGRAVAARAAAGDTQKDVATPVGEQAILSNTDQVIKLPKDKN